MTHSFPTRRSSDPTGSQISTSGEKAHGAAVYTGSTLNMTGGSIATTGLEAHGIAASGSSTVTASNASIAVTGEKRSEEHTSELQSLMRISYAVFCLKKKT